MRGGFCEGVFKTALEGTAWNLGEDVGGNVNPTVFKARRERKGNNRELAAKSGKVALGNPSMMRRGGIFFRGRGMRRKPHELPRGLLTEKMRKAKVASYPFGLKVTPLDPATP